MIKRDIHMYTEKFVSRRAIESVKKSVCFGVGGGRLFSSSVCGAYLYCVQSGESNELPTSCREKNHDHRRRLP